jgi:antitoxin MazE
VTQQTTGAEQDGESPVRTGDSPSIGTAESLPTQNGLADEVEAESRAGRITIQAAGRPRQGWEEAFRSMAARGDDVLLD